MSKRFLVKAVLICAILTAFVTLVFWNQTLKGSGLLMLSSSVNYDLLAPSPERRITGHVYLYNPTSRQFKGTVSVSVAADKTRLDQSFLAAWYSTAPNIGELIAWAASSSPRDKEAMQVFIAYAAARREGRVGLHESELALKEASSEPPVFRFFVDVDLRAGQGCYRTVPIQIPDALCKYPLLISLNP